MTMRDATILTCALSGVVANKAQCPAIPYTPEEYAQESRRAWDAGAVQVHIHARYPDGSPSFRPEEYRLIRDAIQAEVPEILINFSTGAVGIPIEDRVAHITLLRPDVGALNMGSMNYAKWSEKQRRFVFKFVFENSFDDILFLVSRMKDAGVLPELECFDAGHVASAAPLRELGLLRDPVHMSLILGVLGGMPATTANLLHMTTLLPSGANWSVIGISREQWKMVAAALTLGGDVRVGLEDNFHLPSGQMARSNGDLVEVAARLTRDVGRRPATVAEARAILGLEGATT
jgi:uncharacterized protein (DUF849 family)